MAAPPYYWLDAASQPQGPLPLALLAQKSSAGELRRDVLVWHEGSAAGWTALERVLAGEQVGSAAAGSALAQLESAERPESPECVAAVLSPPGAVSPV